MCDFSKVTQQTSMAQSELAPGPSRCSFTALMTTPRQAAIPWTFHLPKRGDVAPLREATPLPGSCQPEPISSEAHSLFLPSQGNQKPPFVAQPHSILLRQAGLPEKSAGWLECSLRYSFNWLKGLTMERLVTMLRPLMAVVGLG